MTAMDDMNKRFRAKLHLSEKERLVVKIDKEELSDTLVACQYLLAARVLTNKSVNKDAFIEVFTTLWCGEQGVSIKDIGECRFVAWFTSLRDKKMVLDMEPWNFRNSLVLLADVKRGGNFRTFDITHAVFWVQFYGIPPLDMTVVVARKIGGFIGRVLDVDQLEGPDHIGGFVRVRIRFDVTQPLMRGAFVEFPKEGKKWIEFSYEHLPAYCLICGCLRHTANVCEERIRGELKAEGMQGEITLFYGFSHLDVKDLPVRKHESAASHTTFDSGSQGEDEGRSGICQRSEAFSDVNGKTGFVELENIATSPSKTTSKMISSGERIKKGEEGWFDKSGWELIPGDRVTGFTSNH